MLQHALGLLLLVAPPAGAWDQGPPPRPVEFSQPAAGASLREGDDVEIRWSGVPAGADEVELLLSVDGGRRFSLRLTEELDSHSRSFRWRVPSLVTNHATLAIRMGVHGREMTSAPGPEFNISRDPAAAGASLRWQAGEIWLGSDGDEQPGRSAVPGAGFSSDIERIASSRPESGALNLTRSPGARPWAASRETPRRDRHAAEASTRAGSPSRVPLSIPQRI